MFLFGWGLYVLLFLGNPSLYVLFYLLYIEVLSDIGLPTLEEEALCFGCPTPYSL